MLLGPLTVGADWSFLKNVQTQKGDKQIAAAKKAIEAGDYKDAFLKLRTGVHYAPDNLEGRLLLSEFYVHLPGLRNLPKAEEILSEGLPYANGNYEYFQRYIQLLLDQQKDQAVIAFAQEELQAEQPPAIKKLLASSMATSLFYRGQFDAAQASIRQYQLAETTDGLLLSAKIANVRGNVAQAILLLEDALSHNQYKRDALYADLTYYCREPHPAKALKYARLRAAAAPEDTGAQIDLLYTLSMNGDTKEAQAHASKILKQFHEDQRALIMLANVAADEGQPALCKQVRQTALKLKMDPAPFELLAIESDITAKNYQQALTDCKAITITKPEWLTPADQGIFNALIAVANTGAGNDEAAEEAIDALMDDPYLRAESLNAIARRFENLGHVDTALRIAQKAHQENPSHQSALTVLIDLEIKTGQTEQLSEHIAQLLTMRHGRNDILAEAYATLSAQPGPRTPAETQTLQALKTRLEPTNAR
ncbi:tetratricopeptide repeat protein [Cerasicoccus maritimus]|uniref:tetratricopeptide repeat protein n=1 Tax=Cerasicoccus maritimus TaxID=490089 RepID=UPI002852D109|nr:hypothetical protein [Cerasicoccus maritimus]